MYTIYRNVSSLRLFCRLFQIYMNTNEKDNKKEKKKNYKNSNDTTTIETKVCSSCFKAFFARERRIINGIGKNH